MFGLVACRIHYAMLGRHHVCTQTTTREAVHPDKQHTIRECQLVGSLPSPSSLIVAVANEVLCLECVEFFLSRVCLLLMHLSGTV